MRIVHLIWGLKTGGAESISVDIANEQAKTNDVSIVVGNSLYDKAVLSELTDNVQLKFLGRSPGSRNPWYGLKLNLLLKKLKPDIIHAHQESFIKLIRYLPAIKVLTIHDTNIQLKTDVSLYDKVFCISKAVKDDLLNRLPYCKTTVVHNGVRFSKIRAKTDYRQHPFQIVQVSRLYHEKKGQDILLRALARVNQVVGNDYATLDFIGAGATGEAKESQNFLEKLACELGVKSRCRFLGERSRKEIYQDLANYDLLVQPSRYEGFGLTVVEAMAARVPVLVSDIEGPMEIIDKGKHGFYFQSENHLDCGNKIIDIMRRSHEAAFGEELAANFMYARGRFDISNTAERYIEEYYKLIDYNRL
jgi:glycosyltransferase involved in cell wall biosynthesis